MALRSAIYLIETMTKLNDCKSERVICHVEGSLLSCFISKLCRILRNAEKQWLSTLIGIQKMTEINSESQPKSGKLADKWLQVIPRCCYKGS